MSAPEVLHAHSELEVAPERHTVLPKPYHDAPYDEAPSYYEQQINTPVKEQRICGLRTTTFFLSLALLLVILAAAIGGGVGGTIAVNNAKNSNKATSNSNLSTVCTTTTIPPPSATGTLNSNSGTTTTSSSITVPTTGLISLDCPHINASQLPIKLLSNSLFNITCGQDFNSAHIDIVAFVAYSLEDCARACASYNQQWNARICKAARFDADLAHLEDHDGTCWLKNGTGTLVNYGDSTSAGLILV